jgi:hypothetical protein
MKRFTFLAALALIAAVLVWCARPTAAHDPHRWEGRTEGAISGVSDEGVVTVAFTGRSTVLGDYIGGGSHVFSNELDFEGVAQFTTERGDKIFVHYQASFDPDVEEPPFPYSGTLTVIGGTGRFRNAGGRARLEAVLNGDLTFEIEFEGRIFPRGRD